MADACLIYHLNKIPSLEVGRAELSHSAASEGATGYLSFADWIARLLAVPVNPPKPFN